MMGKCHCNGENIFQDDNQKEEAIALCKETRERRKVQRIVKDLQSFGDMVKCCSNYPIG